VFLPQPLVLATKRVEPLLLLLMQLKKLSGDLSVS
jgi:hypothetical protein